MKGSLSAQLKMAFFGAGEHDHILATRQSAAAPRERRAKRYDAVERRVRARAQALAQLAADRLADDDDSVATTAPNTDDAGLFTVPPETTDSIEPITPEDDTVQEDASVVIPDASETSEVSAPDLASRIPEI